MARWNTTYAQGDATRSWFQVEPGASLRLITRVAASQGAPVLDAGGGASRLVNAMFRRGFSDITVADISPAALTLSRERLAAEGDRVAWITADLTDRTPPRRFALWHDRAAFHFPPSPVDQERYIEALRVGTLTGASVIIAAFAPDGTERCTGLPVQRWSAEALALRIGPPFVLEHAEEDTHITPAGREQRFAWSVLRRRDEVDHTF